MSFRMTIVVEDREFASSTEKLVMIKLALCGNDDGENVRPSVWTIASDTQLSERTVQPVLKDLVDRGLLTIAKEEDPRHKLPRVYRIERTQVEALPLTAAAQERERRRQEHLRKRSATKSERVVESHPLPSEQGDPAHARVTLRPGTDDTVSPNPLGEPNRKPTTPPPPYGGTPSWGSAPDLESSKRSDEDTDGGRVKSNGTKRGTRLDPDWQPGPADRAYARERRFSEAEINDMAASFRTHFTVLGGRVKKFVKWSGANGAWGNWVRRESPKPGRGLRGFDADRDRRAPASVVGAVRDLINRN